MENASSSKFRLASFEPNHDISFSVVINTDNRIDYLKRTLSGLRYQRYVNFEVCVVCGPTPDGTREYVSAFKDDIKIAYCEERNLSQSRNIGIALASGDVVVFIDDDSVPEAEWLADLAQSYQDSSVGAVGGFVYDHTGVQFQAEFVTTNRLGYPSHWTEPAPHLNYPYSLDVPHLLGTNCSFRRSALLEIGGFDEEYEYFLDETDVCCRINDAGYRIVQRRDGFVHHKYAPSHLRDEKRIVKNWYPLIKNRVYFGMRNALNHHSVEEVIAAGVRDAKGWEMAVVNAQGDGIYSQDDVRRFYEEANSAIQDGYARGLEPPKLLREMTIAEHRSPFTPYPSNTDIENRRVLCFVTQDYPPGQNGGIARYFSQFARALAAEGHHVHVLTKARGPASLDYEDGVWVHRVEIRHFPVPEQSPIAPHIIPGHIWSYCQTMLEEVAAINNRRKVDLVYCPLWDCEPLGFLLDGRFPLMVALQTTMRFWLESQPLRVADTEWMRVFGNPIIAMEEYILGNSGMMHAISQAIALDIQKSYAANIDDEKILYSHLCMDDWSEGVPVPPPSESLRILFVGRLESRKGIDVLLKAAPEVLERFPAAVLDIVGDDTIPRPDGTTYKAEFLGLDLPRDIKDRIIFHGRVEEDELVNFYAACDILVAPSRYESFGLIFLEALVFGKPVIGCHAGGGPEVITNGKTGLLVKPGDVASLRMALSTLLANPDLRQEMGAAGRKDYQARFTTPNMVKDLMGFLNQREAAPHIQRLIGGVRH